MSNTMLIGAHMVRDRVPAEGPIEDRARAAFVAARDPNVTWYTGDEEEMFRAGVAGLLLAVGTDSEEGVRIVAEVKALRALGAATSGVPLDWSALAVASSGHEPIGLLRLWRATADA